MKAKIGVVQVLAMFAFFSGCKSSPPVNPTVDQSKPQPEVPETLVETDRVFHQIIDDFKVPVNTKKMIADHKGLITSPLISLHRMGSAKLYSDEPLTPKQIMLKDLTESRRAKNQFLTCRVFRTPDAKPGFMVGTDFGDPQPKDRSKEDALALARLRFIDKKTVDPLLTKNLDKLTGTSLVKLSEEPKVMQYASVIRYSTDECAKCHKEAKKGEIAGYFVYRLVFAD